MKLRLILYLALVLSGSATLTVAADSDYKVKILSQTSIVQPELMTATNLVGKSIVEVFGPISEVRVEFVVGGDVDNGEGKIRQRIDHAKCLGRESDIPWHQVPWMHGHILLTNGRILSVDILRSGILVGNLLFDDPPAQRHSNEVADSVPALQKYEAYWLNNEAHGGYVKLVLTRRSLAELPSLSLPTNQPVLDCDAVIVTTYERDSIWSMDGKPFKPLTGVTMVGSNFIVIKGEQFASTPAKLEDVLRLLRNPAGTILISRIEGPPSAQKEPVRTFVSRLERQLADRKKEVNQP